MKKRVLIIGAFLVLTAFAAKAEVKTYQCGENCTATLDENGVMRVSGTGAMYGYNATTRYETPWYNDRASISALVVEDGITTVGAFAFFGLGNIQAIDLAKSVQSIEHHAFDAVQKVKNITMSDSTVWDNQDNFNDLAKSPDITIHCRGVLSKCEENLMKTQKKTQSHVTAVAKLGKRIYTVDEANAASREVNRISIRYK